MSYAIFRTSSINKLKDLGQIGAHNQRLKEAYQSNPDIIKEKSVNNIELVACNNTYINEYMKIVKPFKTEHDIRMKTMRDDRKRSFSTMLDESNNVVADEMLFTSDYDFFKGMDKDDIVKWGNICLDFVKKDIGYNDNQILNATIHMDEKTPHLHIVVIPLVKKYDKRAKCEKYSLSKTTYIKDNKHLSDLQDKFYERLINNGYDIERGIKNSDNENISIKQYKALTRKIEAKITKDVNKINEDFKLLETEINSSKETVIGNYIKIHKDTYNNIKNIVKDTKKISKEVPKLTTLLDELNVYNKTNKKLTQENNNLKNEVKKLEEKNKELQNKYDNLLKFFKLIFNSLKFVFNKVLKVGTEKEKDMVVMDVKDLYDRDIYNYADVKEIGKDTDSLYELKVHINDYKDEIEEDIDTEYEEEIDDKDKDDFDIEI